MIILKKELRYEARENIRGGSGKALAANYLKEGDLLNVKFISLLELEPFTTIGEHPHEEDEEFYMVLSGSGTGILDGERFAVSEGDAFVCKKNHAHGIEASGEGLVFLAVLSR